MSRTPSQSDHPDDALRQKAETLLEERTGSDHPAAQDRDRLLHELSVHRIELELQNEELRDALARAEEAEDRYFRLYEFAPTGYAGLGPDGTIADINLAGAALLGTERKNCAGRRLGTFVAQKSHPACSRFLRDAFAGTEKTSCEVALPAGEGSERILRIEGVRTDPGGGGPVCRAALTDISDLRRTERILRLTNRKLNLLTGITRHDIRNQLLMLSGNLVFSKRSLNDPEKTRVFIEKEMDIAEKIGRQILFTREYQSLGTRDPVWQNVGALARRAAEAVSHGSVRVETGDADAEMFADPLLEKVFTNLLDNAVRYGGSAMTAIHVSADLSDAGPRVIFGDNGVGVPAEEKARIFERGYGKNTGLGLFFIREILDLTGCTISETGIPGQGARFEIRVPPGDLRPATVASPQAGLSLPPAPDQFHPALPR